MAMSDQMQGNAAYQGAQGDQGDQGNQGNSSGQPVAVVCIAAMDDGSFEVYQDDPGDAEQADSLDEALNMAADMLEQAAGGNADGQDDGSGGGDDDGDGNAPVGDPQTVWNQLARKSDRSRGV